MLYAKQTESFRTREGDPIEKQLAKYKETWKDSLTKIRGDAEGRKQQLKDGGGGAGSKSVEA